MMNVPTAVWIDESGFTVRGPEPAGSTEAFRHMDRKTFTMPDEARAEAQATRSRYTDLLRTWVRTGKVPATNPVPLSRDDILANSHFALGQHLWKAGHRDSAAKHLAEAIRLSPSNWSFKRQAWALDDPAKASGKEFWEAVDNLGDEKYYPEIDWGDER
jgi:protein-tyrosine-phosphatase